MFDMTDPKTFWLNIMNIGLGLVVLICCIAVARAFMQDLLERRAQRVKAGAYDDHSFLEPALGLTMADGGEQRKSDDK